MTNDISVWLIVAIGFLATEPWRWAGVVFSKGLSEEGELIAWVRAVSTALIAALVMRLLIEPPGSLENTPIILRFLSLLSATIAYFLFQRKLVLSIFIGLAIFLLLLYVNGLVGSPL